MRSFDPRNALRRRALSSLVGWLGLPEGARLLLIGFSPLPPLPSASVVLHFESPCRREQLSGSAAFDAALLFCPNSLDEQLRLAREWLAPGATVVSIQTGNDIRRGPPEGLREARALPFALSLSLRALGWIVLTGRASGQRDGGV